MNHSVCGRHYSETMNGNRAEKASPMFWKVVTLFSSSCTEISMSVSDNPKHAEEQLFFKSKLHENNFELSSQSWKNNATKTTNRWWCCGIQKPNAALVTTPGAVSRNDGNWFFVGFTPKNGPGVGVGVLRYFLGSEGVKTLKFVPLLGSWSIPWRVYWFSELILWILVYSSFFQRKRSFFAIHQSKANVICSIAAHWVILLSVVPHFASCCPTST